MKKIFGTYLMLMSILAIAGSSKDVAVLVQNERDFAKAAKERGTREAFLAFLAEDSILFRPTAVNGKQWMESHPARPGLLSWEPMQVEVSGDLGYTTGPWEFRQNAASEKADAYGYFVTVWKKQTDRNWKAVIDTGISSPAPASPPALTTPSAVEPENAVDFERMKQQLVDLDRNFTAESYSQLAMDYAKVYRNDTAPITGSERIAVSVKGSYMWEPAKACVSSTGNLGYTYGRCKLNGIAGNYLRIWRRQENGSWKYLIDVTTPLQ